jgi:hypothetical protein
VVGRAHGGIFTGRRTHRKDDPSVAGVDGRGAMQHEIDNSRADAHPIRSF